jgi:hypothetical protein
MREIYALRKDQRLIDLVQAATLETRDYGLVPTNGLFGSDEWWDAIETGELDVHFLEGTISRVYMSGHNDFPQFEIEARLNRSQWERKGDDSAYIVGKRVKVVYVEQLLKRGFGVGRDHACVLEIWIED